MLIAFSGVKDLKLTHPLTSSLNDNVLLIVFLLLISVTISPGDVLVKHSKVKADVYPSAKSVNTDIELNPWLVTPLGGVFPIQGN